MKKGLLLLSVLFLPCVVFAAQYSFPAADGNYNSTANPTKVGHQMAVFFNGSTGPDGGTLTVSARPPGATGFIEISVFNSVDVTAPIFVAFSGAVEEFKFTPSSVLNSTSIVVEDTELTMPIGSFYGVD